MARALFASIIATAIVSALIYANARTAFLPEFNLIGDIQDFNARIGLPSTVTAAWVTHAIVGIVIFGMMFAVVQPILPGSAPGEGLWFGFITFLILMTVVLPLAGHEVFAQDLSALYIGSMAVMNLLYGLVMGVAFDALTPSEHDDFR